MDNKVVFSISTEVEMNGRKLQSLKPNKDGIYTGIPLTVLGLTSRNNVCYDRNSVLSCLTDENSRFVLNLKSGDLEGEWGHPLLPVTSKEEMVARLLYLDRKCVSHHFTRVYGKEDPQTGYMIIYGDIKPSGPYKQELIDNFADPTRNVSFSLRSATAIDKKENGVTYKRMLMMFTFDAVDGPGYAEACKRFRDPALESLCNESQTELTIETEADKQQYLAACAAVGVTGQESKIVDQRVLDAFGCDEVRIKEKVLCKTSKGQFVDSAGHAVSLFDTAFGL